MNDYLFNKFMFDGIKTQKAKNLIEMLNKKGFVEKIDNTFKMPQSDIDRVLNYCDISHLEYNLLIKFIENQPINYNENGVQEAILNHKSLSEFALLDENCPQSLKDRMPSHITPQKPPISIDEIIKQTKASSFSEEFEDDEFYEDDLYDEVATPKEIRNDSDFLKEKERCLEIIKDRFRSFEDGLSLRQAVEDCFDVCTHTDDVDYKKELYTSMLSFSNFGQIGSYLIAKSIREEENTDVLLHIFQNCIKILEPQWGNTDVAVMYNIKGNSAITADILSELAKHYRPEDYCQNKFYWFVAEWLIEKQSFPKEAYEYYSKKTDFNYSYRNRNAYAIQEKILYAKNSPDYAIEMIANKGLRISHLAKTRLATNAYGNKLRHIHYAVQNEKTNILYSLDNETKAKLLSYISEDYPLPWVVAALITNNNMIKDSDMSISFSLMTYYALKDSGYSNDDLLNCYHIIKQYENSNAFKLVMAEREYLNEKENGKQSRKREVIEDVLSDNLQWVGIISDITDEEMEK